jgi:glycerol-3-phosphate O-acyltransferase/dihydroxyacetone phosphate acyltransferase
LQVEQSFYVKMSKIELEMEASYKGNGLVHLLATHVLEEALGMVMNIFFSQIEVLGHEHIPKYGPCIFVANHNNQFVDGILLYKCAFEEGRKPRFIIAEKSWHRFGIGHLAKLFQCIPVARAQDGIKKGNGTIKVEKDSTLVVGTSSTFVKHIGVGDSLKIGDGTYKVQSVESNTELHLEAPYPSESDDCIATWKISKKSDLQGMYGNVYKHFSYGGALGIFPEGGSHDRTELLDLKPGVCIMALGAMSKYPGMNVKIVPCGLNYTASHEFRSRVVAQFGPPIEISPELLESYKTDKRDTVSTLLDQVTESLKSVVIETPDHEALVFIHSLRRLYLPIGKRLSPHEYQAINLKFGKIYKETMNTEECKKLQIEIIEYRNDLDFEGLSDRQVKRMQQATATGRKRDTTFLLLQRILTMMFWTIIAFPGMLLSGPVGYIADVMAKRKRKEALASSDVKLKGLDVVATWKLMAAIVLIPVALVTYTFSFGLIVYLYFGFDLIKTIFMSFLFMLFLPYYCHFSVMLYGDFIKASMTLKPLFLRASGAISETGSVWAERRAGLQAEVRHFISKSGQKVFGDNFNNDRIIKLEDFEKEKKLLRKASKNMKL